MHIFIYNMCICLIYKFIAFNSWRNSCQQAAAACWFVLLLLLSKLTALFGVHSGLRNNKINAFVMRLLHVLSALLLFSDKNMKCGGGRRHTTAETRWCEKKHTHSQHNQPKSLTKAESITSIQKRCAKKKQKIGHT